MYERKKNFFQDEKFFSFHFGENLIRARHKKCFKRVEFSAELNDLLDPACNTVPMFASRVAFKFIFFLLQQYPLQFGKENLSRGFSLFFKKENNKNTFCDQKRFCSKFLLRLNVLFKLPPPPRCFLKEQFARC